MRTLFHISDTVQTTMKILNITASNVGWNNMRHIFEWLERNKQHENVGHEWRRWKYYNVNDISSLLLKILNVNRMDDQTEKSLLFTSNI